jgi:hypothetical protein
MPGENTRLIISGLITFAAGYGLHVLKARGDNRARKHADENARKDRIRNFKSFMSSFRSWAERSSQPDLGRGFHEKVNAFRGETGQIEDDLLEPRRTRFNQAVLALCGLTGSQVTECEITTDVRGNAHVINIGRDRLASAIDAVLETLA